MPEVVTLPWICVRSIYVRVIVDACSGVGCVQTAGSGDLIYPNSVLPSESLFEIHILSGDTLAIAAGRSR